MRASEAWPKPAGGAPRVLVGGAAGPRLFAQIAAQADGWLPIGGRGLAGALPILRTAWEEAGRDPKALQVVPYAVLPNPDKLAYYADLGCEEVVSNSRRGRRGGAGGARRVRAVSMSAA